MGLALVIPVRDDPEGLQALLRRAEELALFEQIVVVDDGSQVALELPQGRLPLTLLRQHPPAGAGAARNRGLDVVTSSHLLFFDSDDQLTHELLPLWQELQGREFDFCQFRHHDSRMGPLHRWGQMPFDDRLWRLVGLAGRGLQALTPTQAPILAQTANYPWNKIYRRSFLQTQGVRCTEIPLHNDIELHWGSYLSAPPERILVSNRVGARHVVHPGGHRLSNRRDAARLQLFEALEALLPRFSALPEAQQAPWRAAFLQFLGGLMLWVRERISSTLHPVFDCQVRSLLHQMMTPEVQALLSRQDPVRCLQLLLQMTSPEPTAASADFANALGDPTP